MIDPFIMQYSTLAILSIAASAAQALSTVTVESQTLVTITSCGSAEGTKCPASSPATSPATSSEATQETSPVPVNSETSAETTLTPVVTPVVTPVETSSSNGTQPSVPTYEGAASRQFAAVPIAFVAAALLAL